MERRFEPLFVCAELWEGPRSGLAAFNGRPHFYQSEFRDFVDLEPLPEDTFLVLPLDPATFQMVRAQLGFVDDPRSPYAKVGDLSKVTIYPGMLPSRIGCYFAGDWDQFRMERLGSAAEGLRVHGDFRCRGIEIEDENANFVNNVPMEVTWREASQPYVNRSEIDALIRKIRILTGKDESSPLVDDTNLQGEDIPF